MFCQVLRVHGRSLVLLIRLVSFGARFEQIDVLDVVILCPILVEVLLVRELLVHSIRQIIAIFNE